MEPGKIKMLWLPSKNTPFSKLKQKFGTKSNNSLQQKDDYLFF
jgi:hypothetical protein